MFAKGLARVLTSCLGEQTEVSHRHYVNSQLLDSKQKESNTNFDLTYVATYGLLFCFVFSLFLSFIFYYLFMAFICLLQQEGLQLSTVDPMKSVSQRPRLT